jgi:hypothetical protein
VVIFLGPPTVAIGGPARKNAAIPACPRDSAAPRREAASPARLPTAGSRAWLHALPPASTRPSRPRASSARAPARRAPWAATSAGG